MRRSSSTVTSSRPRDHDAAFLAVMGQRHPAGVAARLVAFFQDLQAPAEQVVADLAEGDRLLADLGQFVGAIERLARPLRLDREELGEPHRQAVEDALERADARGSSGSIRSAKSSNWSRRSASPARAATACDGRERSGVAHRYRRSSEIPVASVSDRTNMPSSRPAKSMGCRSEEKDLLWLPERGPVVP